MLSFKAQRERWGIYGVEDISKMDRDAYMPLILPCSTSGECPQNNLIPWPDDPIGAFTAYMHDALHTQVIGAGLGVVGFVYSEYHRFMREHDISTTMRWVYIGLLRILENAMLESSAKEPKEIKTTTTQGA